MRPFWNTGLCVGFVDSSPRARRKRSTKVEVKPLLKSSKTMFDQPIAYR